ncbi:MAG: aminotransferase class I/II-fold pyridoxal phosphate-dependent enzyme, partial [Lachnospiraceae bacterium]|nr:aminotransferase class I/II-fold pyridoxal phosphate-dependent enzyme [Lachnospiraceae bacterium]
MKKQVHGGDVYRYQNALDFSSNMNPLGTPERVIQAARDSMGEICNYPDIQQEKLISGIADWEDVPAEWIICGNGAAEVIFTLVHALKPKTALLLAPTFAEYEQALEAEDCQISFHHLKEETGFLVDEDLLADIKEETEVLFLCNPNNPTGLLIPSALMDKIIKRCSETGTFLVIDECFQDFIPEPEVYTRKKDLEEKKDMFLLKAFTKRYAMAGIRLGYGLTSNQELLDKMHRVVQPWNVSIPAQAAGVAALKETEYLAEGREIVFREQLFLKAKLQELGFKVYDSQANYIFFRGPEGLVEKAWKSQVLIRDCGNYRGLCQGYYRVAVKTHE